MNIKFLIKYTRQLDCWHGAGSVFLTLGQRWGGAGLAVLIADIVYIMVLIYHRCCEEESGIIGISQSGDRYPIN